MKKPWKNWKEWPDDWPVEAIGFIEQLDEECERLERQYRKLVDAICSPSRLHEPPSAEMLLID